MSAKAVDYDVIVMGGGPGGSTLATLAATAGLRVLVLEADRHPRAHVGESLLPGIIPILNEMGVLDEVERAGFGRKSGTTHKKWGRTPEWDLWFSDTESYDHAWLVDRSRFDELLFRAAARAGATTLEHAAVKRLVWSGDRLEGVCFQRRDASDLELATARFVVDASGQSALLARELGLREVIDGLRHQASWAHYEHAGALASPRENQALFVAEAGHWLWLFPMGGGHASVGIVRLDERAAVNERDRTAAFERDVAASPELSRVLGARAQRVTKVRTERDWSYRMRRVAGPGWLLVGDASGFIDPVLSTGVFLAMHAAHHAARTLTSVLRGERTELDAMNDYQAHHAELFGDLLRMVRFYYQQNLHVEDYFWESKRILLRPETELKPQKAFLILTSGLVKNLSFDDLEQRTHERRLGEVDQSTAAGLEREEPSRLGFVCFHLQTQHDGTPAQLYLLIEPTDAAAPSLFRTPSFDVNCLAPRFDNDPIRVPGVAEPLRQIHEAVRAADTTTGEALASFWRRNRARLLEAVRRTEPNLVLIRVFGE